MVNVELKRLRKETYRFIRLITKKKVKVPRANMLTEKNGMSARMSAN